jgi:hypothetical protein
VTAKPLPPPKQRSNDRRQPPSHDAFKSNLCEESQLESDVADVITQRFDAFPFEKFLHIFFASFPITLPRSKNAITNFDWKIAGRALTRQVIKGIDFRTFGQQ